MLSKWPWLADTEAALLPRRSFGVFWTTGFPNRQSFSGGSPVCRKHAKQKSSGKTKKTEKTKKTKICRRDGLAPSPNSLANFGFFGFFGFSAALLLCASCKQEIYRKMIGDSGIFQKQQSSGRRYGFVNQMATVGGHRGSEFGIFVNFGRFVQNSGFSPKASMFRTEIRFC